MRFFFIAILLSLSMIASSQMETSNWYFGNSEFLEFNEDSLVSITYTGTATTGNCYFNSDYSNSSISDSAGNYLFSCNGEIIQNANCDTLLNGALMGHKSTAQNIIVPRPGYNSRYYVFYPQWWNNSTGFRYSEIDMLLDSGWGGVIPGQLDVLLETDVTDRVSAVKHANKKDIWVITHKDNTNNFLAYLVTENGVNPTPIISSVGMNISDIPSGINSGLRGCIKISPCGRWIATASMGEHKVKLARFDTETGMVESLPILLDVHYPYYLEFSGDGNILYCGGKNAYGVTDTAKIYQVNLLETSAIGISNSVYHLNDFTIYPPNIAYNRSLQLAMDGKIYVGYAGGSTSNMGVINEPHFLDTNCNFIYNQYLMPYLGEQMHGFPNFMTSYFDKNVFATTACFGDSTMIYTLNSDLFDSIRWEITDPVTGQHVYHNQDTVFHLYSQAGHFTVHCFRYRGQYVDDFEKKLQVVPYAQALSHDTTLCAGEQVQLSFTGNFGTNVYWYRQQPLINPNWELVDSGQVLTVTEMGYYLPKIDFWDVCGDKPDTSYIDVINISLDLGDDTLTGNCITDPYWLTPQWNIYDVDFWQWNTGSFNFLLMPDTSGMYILYASGGNCEEEDSVYVLYDEALSIDLGSDLQLCDDSAWLEIASPSEDYFWMPYGDTTQGIYTNQSGQYVGMAVNACGDYSDTINVLIGETPPELSILDTVICAGDSLLTDPPILEASYQWSTGDTVPNIYLHDAGNYNLTISNFCGTRVMDVDLALDSFLELSWPDTLWVNSGDSAFIEAGIEATSYFWSTGASDPFIWVSDSGLYALTVTNACGEVSDSIVVLNTLTILDNEKFEFSFYPNPSSSSIIIELDKTHIGAVLSIHTILGTQVFEQKLLDTKNKVNLNNLPTGNYLLRIGSENEIFTNVLIRI